MLALRKRYVDAYAACLRAGALGGDADTRAMDTQLNPAAILSFRRLAHARVEAGAKRAAAAAAAAARAGARRSWGEWWRGAPAGTDAAIAEAGGGGATTAATDPAPPSLADLTDAEVAALEDMEASRVAAAAGARTPFTLLTRVTVAVDAASLVLDGADGAPDILHAGLGGASLAVDVFPDTLSTRVAVASAGVTSPEGPLLRTAAADGDDAVSVIFVRRPQDGSADASLRLALAPSFVTVAPPAAARVASFFKPERPLALASLGAAAAAGAERARRAASAALAAALRDRPRLNVAVDLDAPVVALPVVVASSSTTADGSHPPPPLTLVVDLGTLRVRSVPSVDGAGGGREAFHVASADVSAWLSDTDAAAALAAAAGAGAPPSAAAPPPPRRIVLLDRCGATADVDVPTGGGGGGAVRAALRVPRVSVCASPARAARLARVAGALAAVTGGGGGGNNSLAAPAAPAWGTAPPEHAGSVSLLERSALGPRWAPRFATLHRGRLWLAPSDAPAALAAATSHDAWAGRVAVRVPAAAVSDGGAPPSLFALVRPGADPSRALADRDALVLRAPDADTARDWLRNLDRSAALMRDLAGGGAGAARAAAALGENDDAAPADGGASTSPPPPIDLAAQLGELEVLLCGRPPLPWWTAGGGDEGATPATDADGELPLAAVRATAGRASALLAPGGGVSAAVAIGAFEVEDLLVAGGVAGARRHLARSARADAKDAASLAATPASSRPPTAAAATPETPAPPPAADSGDGTPFATPAGVLPTPRSPAARADSGRDTADEAFYDADDGTSSVGGPESPTARAAAAAVGLAGDPAASLELTAAPPTVPPPSDGTPPVSLAVKLAGLDFWWRRPTVAALIACGSDLAAALAGRSAGGAPPTAPPPTAADDTATTLPSAASFGLDLAVTRFRVTFEYEDAAARPLGVATADALSVRVSVAPGPRITLVADLGNLTADDGALDPGHPLRRAVGLRPGAHDSLVSLTLAARPSADADADDRVPSGAAFYTLTARLQALRVVYLNRLLQEALAYITLTFRLAPPPLEGGGAGAAPARAPPPPPPTRPPVIVALHIDADAPIVTMPRHSDSEDAIELDLGTLTLRSRVAWRGGLPGSPSAALVETTTIRGTRLGGRGVVAGVVGGNVVTRYDEGVAITLARPLIDARGALPSTVAVDVTVPTLQATLSAAEYALVTTVAADNVAEGVRLPRAGRWMEERYPVPDVPVVWADALPTMEAADDAQADMGGCGGDSAASAFRAATRCTVRVGSAELRLTHAPSGAGAPPEPLACLSLGDVTVDWASDGRGGARADVAVPHVTATDERPGVPRARARPRSRGAHPPRLGRRHRRWSPYPGAGPRMAAPTPASCWRRRESRRSPGF